MMIFTWSFWAFFDIPGLGKYGFTARKAMFFSKYSEKMFFPKKSRWNMIFLVLSGKMIFLFPENIILFFRRKMKDDLSQKKYMKIWYFFQIFWKDGLSKKITLEYDLSCCIIGKDDRSHSRKSSNYFLYSYGDIHTRFHILLSSEKKIGNLIYRIKTWFLFQLSNTQFNTLYHSALRNCI